MSDQTPQFLTQIQTEYTSKIAHTFIVTGNISDYIDNSGLTETPVDAMFSFADDGHAKRNKEKGVDRGLQEVKNSNSIIKAVATYDIASGLQFASPSSHAAWVDIITKHYGAKEIEDWRGDWQAPVSPDAFFWVMNKWHAASKAVNEENRTNAAMGKGAARTELLLYLVFPNADALFPNGQIAQLGGDRQAIVTLRNWAKDEKLGARNIFILLSRHITDINESLRGASSGIVSTSIPKPNINDRKEWLQNFSKNIREMAASKGGSLKLGNNLVSDVNYAADFDEHQFAVQSAGMSRKQLYDVIMKSWKDGNPIDFRQVRTRKQKAIDDEYEGIVDFFEPEHGFEQVGGHEYVKKYFVRKIITPLRNGDARLCSSGVLLNGPPGTGKCLAPGTEILMFDGTIRKVEHIKVGDKLMGPDSNPRTVMSLASGRDNMFHVVPTKGSSYTVNEPHILSVKTSGTHKITNISVADFLNKPKSWQEKAKGYRSKVVFVTKSVPLDPYFLGLWLGDGDSSDVRITTKDTEVIEFLNSLAKDLSQTVSKYEYPERCPSYAIVNKSGENVIRTELKKLEVLNNKHIPLLYKANDYSVQRNVLAGILDADGSFDKKGKVFDFINKNEILANDVAYIARSLGLAAYVSVCQKTCVNNGVEGTYFRVCISGDLTIIPCKIARKIPSERNSVKDVLKVGIQIVPAGVGDYFGFELDGDKLFLLADFTVTHNTQIAMALAKEAQMNFMVGHLGKLFGGLVGETEQKTRKFFEAVESAAPVIVFIDEIDSVLSSGRTSHGDSGVAARVFNSVMQFLSDGSRKGKVVVVAASNRPDLLDAALIRSGRFDAKLPTLPPAKGDSIGRAAILQSLCNKHGIKFSKDMQKTVNDPNNGLGRLLMDNLRIWTGAEIEVVIKESLDNAVFADRKDKNGAAKQTIEVEDWNQAMNDILPNTEEVERMTLLALLFCDTLAYIPPEWREMAKDKSKIREELGLSRN